MKHLVRALGVVVALGLAATGRGVTVIPEATDELLANPGTGWQTFHCFADEDKSLAGLPSGVAYFRAA